MQLFLFVESCLKQACFCFSYPTQKCSENFFASLHATLLTYLLISVFTFRCVKGQTLVYCIWTCDDEQDCVLGCFLQPVPLFLHNLFPCSVTHLQQGVSYLFIPLMISVWAVIWSHVPMSPNYLWISTQPAVNSAPVEELGSCSLSIRLVEPFFSLSLFISK